jgi:hypothetical protein
VDTTSAATFDRFAIGRKGTWPKRRGQGCCRPRHGSPPGVFLCSRWELRTLRTASRMKDGPARSGRLAQVPGEFPPPVVTRQIPETLHSIHAGSCALSPPTRPQLTPGQREPTLAC